jgi:PadR family transcriptional regulator PadR
MAEKIRFTLQTKLVLKAMSKEPLRARYGLDISKESGLPDGTIYPILARLHRAGLLHREWEDIDPVKEGRPRRRLYRITGDGVRVARELDASTPRLGWAPDPGAFDEGSPDRPWLPRHLLPHPLPPG